MSQEVKKYRCLGFSINGKLQTYCPVKATCRHYLKKEGIDKMPSNPIFASGCRKYDRISREEFSKGAKNEPTK